MAFDRQKEPNFKHFKLYQKKSIHWISTLSEKSNELQIHAKIQNSQNCGYNDNNNNDYKKNFCKFHPKKIQLDKISKRS